ncbi:flavin-containing monooxygenase [Sphingomonas sp. KC8]|uniref:flavin-containing monooxygenase n=1 Tax=Sphingomonas sp. KC8 TaxID=1030157 RepID=UPI000248982E|nr:NAD(P)/FAD-dependent oxidoreductase [Sphingomonas sp. KC8]ARS29345.1 flavin-containing monooxygenase [Sphingomonas sp. KC8]
MIPYSAGIRVAVIGAGMAGILAGIKLKEAGLSNFRIYEKADRIGGTWRENSYPGLTCDVPSHAYTYSFEPNPDWSHHLPPGPEIQAYFEGVVAKYDLDPHIAYGEELVRCAFEGGRWHLESGRGTRDVADIVIAATGVLHHPSYPDIAGIDSFGGACFHSARWDHSVPLDGQRIGIIGNGSTGVQIVSALASRAGHLKHFQRSAQWIIPTPNGAFSEAERAAFGADPFLLKSVQNDPAYLELAWGWTEAIVDAGSAVMAETQAVARANLENSVRDPVLREKLRPTYRAGCKRLIHSPDYYQAIQHPNAELVTDGIVRIEAGGVRTADDRLHELDVLVFATGFDAHQFMRPMNVIGRNGVELNQAWAKRPAAYMAISIPDFPNLFMLNGPSGPVGNFSLIDIAERQWTYISHFINMIASGRAREISASHAALADYEEQRIEAAKTTIWGSGCTSWYLDADGVPSTWPWSYRRFAGEMAVPRLDAYDVIGANVPGAVH